MKVRSLLLSAAAAATLISSATAAEMINGAGASFPAPLYFEWAHAYQAATGNQVNYQSIGSGGGVKQVQARTVDFGASDEPLDLARQKADKLLQFPAVVGGIAIAYNLPELGGAELKISNSVAEGIFMGAINNWADPKIKADNPTLNLPNKKIIVVHRSDGSGTTWNFTYWLDKVSAAWHGSVGLGKTVKWPVGIGGKGNEGVANMLKQAPGTIGYIETAYAKKNNLPMATLQSAEKTWVKPTTESIKAAAASANWKASEGFYEILALEKGKNTYPIAAATFILLPAEKGAANKKVKEFFGYAFSKGDATAEKLGYIPLPDVTTKAIGDYLSANGVK
jgi:phosphate transport system substrate-binding protein